MNTSEKLDAIKMALIETNRDELVDYVNDVAQHIAEQDKTIEMMGEPALDESLEELLQPQHRHSGDQKREDQQPEHYRRDQSTEGILC